MWMCHTSLPSLRERVGVGNEATRQRGWLAVNGCSITFHTLLMIFYRVVLVLVLVLVVVVVVVLVVVLIVVMVLVMVGC